MMRKVKSLSSSEMGFPHHHLIWALVSCIRCQEMS